MRSFAAAVTATVVGSCVSLIASNSWASSTISAVKSCSAVERSPSAAVAALGIELPVHLTLTVLAAACYSCFFGVILASRWWLFIGSSQELPQPLLHWLAKRGRKHVPERQANVGSVGMVDPQVLLWVVLFVAGLTDALSSVLWFVSMKGVTPSEQAIMQASIPLFATLLTDVAAIRSCSFILALVLTLSGLLVSVSGDTSNRAGERYDALTGPERAGYVAIYLASCAIYAAWASVQKYFFDTWSSDVRDSQPAQEQQVNTGDAIVHATLLFGDGIFTAIVCVTLLIVLGIEQGAEPVWSTFATTVIASTSSCFVNGDRSISPLPAGVAFVVSEIATYWSLAFLNRLSPMQSSMIVQVSGPGTALVVALTAGLGQDDVLRQVAACLMIAAATWIERHGSRNKQISEAILH